MLPISIQKNQNISGGNSNAALDRSPVANIIRMAVNNRTRLLCGIRRAIGGSIINHNDVKMRISGFYIGNKISDGLAFIIDRDNYRRFKDAHIYQLAPEIIAYCLTV